MFRTRAYKGGAPHGVRRAAWAALALVLAACVLALPASALAVSASERSAQQAAVTADDAPEREWNGDDHNKDKAPVDELGDKPMYSTDVEAGFLDAGSVPAMMNNFCFNMLANAADLCAVTAGLVMGNMSVSNLFTPFSSGDWLPVYEICVAVAENAVVPIATAFLGLLMCAELVQFAKEQSSGRGGADLLGAMLFIVVKYGLLQMLVANTTLVMGGIYGLVNEIGSFMVSHLGVGTALSGGGNWGVVSAVDSALTSITYDQGAGAALLVALVGIVAMSTCILTYVYVQVVFVMRMFELYLRTAFAGFPMVMCASRSTRDGGIRYFKKYAGCCLQALVVVLVISVGGVVMGICANIRTVQTGNIVADLVISAAPAVVGALAMFMMVKQSREFSDQIAGA